MLWHEKKPFIKLLDLLPLSIRQKVSPSEMPKMKEKGMRSIVFVSSCHRCVALVLAFRWPEMF